MTQYVTVLLSQKAISLSCKSNALMDGTVSHTMYAQRVFMHPCILLSYTE